MEIYDEVADYISRANQNINLIASENVLPEKATLPYSKNMLNRYVFKSERQLYFTGREDLYRLELECCKLVGDFLNSEYVSLKTISGLNAMTCIIALFTKPGDIVYSISPKHGGHNVTKHMVQCMGRISRYIPFDEQNMDIDFAALEEEFANDTKSIGMVYVDLMNILFNIDVTRLRQITPSRICLVYDASHVMALIMGNRFKNPLDEGVDILVGTTHKTLPGPHKAIFATNNRVLYRNFDIRNGAFISSQHPADVYSLGIVLEGMKSTMEEYASAIVTNAKLLASILKKFNLPVLGSERGYTDTHQLWIGERNTDLYPFIDQLMHHKIMTNGIMIPYIGEYGIRIGVQEVTFCGFQESEIIELGTCIGLIYSQSERNVDRKIRKLIQKKDTSLYYKR